MEMNEVFQELFDGVDGVDGEEAEAGAMVVPIAWVREKWVEDKDFYPVPVQNQVFADELQAVLSMDEAAGTKRLFMRARGHSLLVLENEGLTRAEEADASMAARDHTEGLHALVARLTGEPRVTVTAERLVESFAQESDWSGGQRMPRQSGADAEPDAAEGVDALR